MNQSGSERLANDGTSRAARLTGLLVVAVLMSGCGAVNKVLHRQGTDPVKQKYSSANPQMVRSDFPNLDTYASLVSDHRAYDVGESVTILVLEEASSTTSADTRTQKKIGASGRLDQTFRFDEGSLSLENSAEGTGTISREGRLVASVSAIVQDVLPNGELLIFGEQTIEFNDETQYIRVAGRIRPEDISASNTVPSTRIAEAEILYKGYGLLGSNQKPGFITRVLNWVF